MVNRLSSLACSLASIPSHRLPSLFRKPIFAIPKRVPFQHLQSHSHHQKRWSSQSVKPKPEGDTVKKTTDIGLLLFCVGLGASLVAIEELCAHKIPSPFYASSESITLSPLEGKAWVEKCLQRYPEILWLADKGVRKTEEGQATLQGSYSEQLFGQKYVEFDRTIMTLHCLRLIIKGDYETLTAAQPENVKLSPESFQNLYQKGQRLLKSNWGGLSESQMLQAMETALVLGDMGKSEKAREVFKFYGVKAPDHDDFYGEAIKVMVQHPTLCPSFARLPSAAKSLLSQIANIAHYGHITHLEGGLKILSSLKESEIASKNPTALNFDLFVHRCDVIGALGHINNTSSIVYTELTHQAMQAMAEAVKTLSDPSKSELDAYNAYLSVRASWLGLDPTNPSDRVLARIGAMLRLFTIQEGVILRKAMQELDPSIQEHIAEQLNVHEKDDNTRTPTYMPAVLVNLSNNEGLGLEPAERLTQAVTLGLPFIARVLEKHKKLVKEGKFDPRIPLNFNTIAGIAKVSPFSLHQEFYIDAEGSIHLFVKREDTSAI